MSNGIIQANFLCMAIEVGMGGGYSRNFAGKELPSM